MAPYPCCGEDHDMTTKQVIIIIVILCVCVVIAVVLLCVNIQNEFHDIQNFHFGFEGRKMMLKEKKLVYKCSMQQVIRYSKVGEI